MKKLEIYLLHVAQRQKWMIYSIVIIIVGMLVYNIATPMAEDAESLQNRIETLEQGIAKDSANSLKKRQSCKKGFNAFE